MNMPNSDVLSRIVYGLASSIDTPRSLAVWLCFKHDHEALLQLPRTDLADDDTLKVQLDYFITEYLSKYKELNTSYDLRAVALEKWYASESQCRDTNKRFRTELRDFSSRVSATLFVAQRKIASILGRFDLYLASTECKWANGATYDIPMRDAAPDTKMTRTISVTSQALPYLRTAIEHDPHWFYALSGIFPDGEYCILPNCVKIVRGSRFLTVPKNAKTDRCIAAEPTGNSFLQQGLHNYMVRRLKRFGVDLSNQERNQQAAQAAYTAGLATLDLSSASDTVSRELVYHLLPLDWAFYMDSLRSPETRVDKTWIRTEKFASMGNAFCFELETLIFYALARAVCGENSTVEVYGDDIIVPAVHYEELVTLLNICGFSVNMSKSYASGYFYESCGEHYHKGSRITPPYQKEPLRHPSELVRAHNRLVRYGDRLPMCPLKKRIHQLSKWMLSTHPDRHVPLIPKGVEGDDGYLVHPFKLLRAYNKNHGFKCRVLVWSTLLKDATSECALYAYKLRRPSFQNSLASGASARVVGGRWVYKTRWVPESDAVLD